jgi:phospholipid transport system substrate-binding protein
MPTTIKSNLAWIALFVVALCPPTAWAETAAAQIAATAETAKTADGPTETSARVPSEAVESFHDGLLAIMKEAKSLGFEGRIDQLAPLMAETFDLDFMASKTVGRHWKKLSDEDRLRWATTFAQFTTANYAGRFTGFTGEEFVTLGVEDGARGTRVVLTKILVPDGDDVQLNYRLIERDGNWKVIDVYLNGTVSELALRRSEYSSALKREGFAHLLDSVESKIADLRAKGQLEG